MIQNILLDIDGVCNTFQHYVFNRLGLPYPDDSCYPAECGWDIVAAANKIAGYERFTAMSFWNSITREMWANIPPSVEFSDSHLGRGQRGQRAYPFSVKSDA